MQAGAACNGTLICALHSAVQTIFSTIDLSTFRDRRHKGPFMRPANVTDLAVCFNKQVAGITDLTGCENKLTNLELLDELSLQEPCALLLVERNKYPILLPDFFQNLSIGCGAAKELAMALVPYSRTVQLLDHLVIIEVVV